MPLLGGAVTGICYLHTKGRRGPASTALLRLRHSVAEKHQVDMSVAIQPVECGTWCRDIRQGFQMKSVLLASSCMLLIAGAAEAADTIQYEALPPAGLLWSGGYVGLQAGHAWSDGRVEVIGAGNYAEPDPDGFLGGVYAGYNHQFANNMVLGIEADLARADIDGSDAGRFPDGTVFPGVDISSRVEWTGALRARAGYAVDRFLPYAAGGVAFAKYKVSVDDNGLIGADKQTLTGWTIGAGVEYAISDNVIGRFEYRYTDFGNDKGFFGDADIDLSSHDLRVGIAYKF
jgi:outer membrane immunogenic protein